MRSQRNILLPIREAEEKTAITLKGVTRIKHSNFSDIWGDWRWTTKSVHNSFLCCFGAMWNRLNKWWPLRETSYEIYSSKCVRSGLGLNKSTRFAYGFLMTKKLRHWRNWIIRSLPDMFQLAGKRFFFCWMLLVKFNDNFICKSLRQAMFILKLAIDQNKLNFKTFWSKWYFSPWQLAGKERRAHTTFLRLSLSNEVI